MVIAKTRLETLQACKLLQCVRRRDLVQIERLVANGVPGLLDYNDPAAAPPPDKDNGTTKAARQRPDLDDDQSSAADGDTALTWATSENDMELVEFLLRHGADPDATDLRGRTAVFRAAERGYVECMRRLLHAGANLQVTDVNGKGTCVIVVHGRNHLELSEIKIKCNIN
jgi:ankyrin repeat protein